MTFSVAERRWRKLIDYLLENKVVEQAPGESISSLEQRAVRADPVTYARYYVHRFQAMKRYLMSKSHPLGQLEDYYFVIEFQSRGSQHDHGLLWVKDTTRLGINSD